MGEMASFKVGMTAKEEELRKVMADKKSADK